VAAAQEERKNDNKGSKYNCFTGDEEGEDAPKFTLILKYPQRRAKLLLKTGKTKASGKKNDQKETGKKNRGIWARN